MVKLRCLVVDDEPLGRSLVEENISQIPFLEWVASCKNAFEAMEWLEKEPIDLMFLDIQMPGMLGTKFLSSLRAKPMVIFVTAYSNYAVESYELDVIDYLMKPLSLERFTKAVFKALEAKRKSQPVTSSGMSSQGSDVSSAEPDSIFVHVEYSLVKVIIADMAYIEGMKDYVKIYRSAEKKPLLTKSTLKRFEEMLSSRGFMRVHKSFIVNLDKIESIRNQQITIGDREIPVSESNLDALMKALL